MSGSNDDFDTAKAISELLKGLDLDKQQRILRWVAESLSIPLFERKERAADVSFPQPTMSQSTIPGRTADIKSFVESKSPKSDIQFAATVAYYYRFEAPADDRLDAISADVLQNATRLTSRQRLKAPLVTLNNAKRQGYLDTAERGSFRINSVGENLVAMTLPGGNDIGAATRVKKRQKSNSKQMKKRRKPGQR